MFRWHPCNRYFVIPRSCLLLLLAEMCSIEYIFHHLSSLIRNSMISIISIFSTNIPPYSSPQVIVLVQATSSAASQTGDLAAWTVLVAPARSPPPAPATLWQATVLDHRASNAVFLGIDLIFYLFFTLDLLFINAVLLLLPLRPTSRQWWTLPTLSGIAWALLARRESLQELRSPTMLVQSLLLAPWLQEDSFHSLLMLHRCDVIWCNLWFHLSNILLCF